QGDQGRGRPPDHEHDEVQPAQPDRPKCPRATKARDHPGEGPRESVAYPLGRFNDPRQHAAPRRRPERGRDRLLHRTPHPSFSLSSSGGKNGGGFKTICGPFGSSSSSQLTRRNTVGSLIARPPSLLTL